MQYIGWFVAIGGLVAAMSSGGGLLSFVDAPSFLLVVAVSFGAMQARFSFQDIAMGVKAIWSVPEVEAERRRAGAEPDAERRAAATRSTQASKGVCVVSGCRSTAAAASNGCCSSLAYLATASSATAESAAPRPRGLEPSLPPVFCFTRCSPRLLWRLNYALALCRDSSRRLH